MGPIIANLLNPAIFSLEMDEPFDKCADTLKAVLEKGFTVVFKRTYVIMTFINFKKLRKTNCEIS